MSIRWYRIGVFLLWFTAMGWLVMWKILPALMMGEPPTYAMAAADKPQPPVGWNLYINQQRIGWALSELSRQATDTTEIHSLVHFDGAPLVELFPVYLRQIARVSVKARAAGEMEVNSVMLINPLGQLQHFHSRLRMQPSAKQSLAYIEGNVDGDKLKLSFRFGESSLENMELPMPENKIRDSFSPETELVGLHKDGQAWTLETYSPFTLPSNPFDVWQRKPPTELLYARVEGQVPIIRDGQSELVWLVVYRAEAGSSDDKSVRNRLWVSREGTVLRQEVTMGGNSLMFNRMAEKDAVELRAKLKDFSD